MILSGEKVEGERCMSAEGTSVKGSSQQSSTYGPKVKGGGPLFSGWGPLITGGLVNDTTPEHDKVNGLSFLLSEIVEFSCVNLTLFLGSTSE